MNATLQSPTPVVSDPVDPGVATTDTPMPLVLIVDNEPAMRGFIGTVLKRAGMEPIEVANWAVALRVLDLHYGAIDALVMDIPQPDQDSLTLLQEIKQSDPQIPIVMMTDHKSIRYAVEAIRHGATSYLTKPLEAAKFAEIVLEAAKRRQRSRNEEQNACERRLGTNPFFPSIPQTKPTASGTRIPKPKPALPIRCPECHGRRAAPSRMRGLEYLFVLLLFRAYVCLKCEQRFWHCWLLWILLPKSRMIDA